VLDHRQRKIYPSH
jgi:hypothetical protein